MLPHRCRCAVPKLGFARLREAVQAVLYRAQVAMEQLARPERRVDPLAVLRVCIRNPIGHSQARLRPSLRYGRGQLLRASSVEASLLLLSCVAEKFQKLSLVEVMAVTMFIDLNQFFHHASRIGALASGHVNIDHRDAFPRPLHKNWGHQCGTNVDIPKLLECKCFRRSILGLISREFPRPV